MTRYVRYVKSTTYSGGAYNVGESRLFLVALGVARLKPKVEGDRIILDREKVKGFLNANTDWDGNDAIIYQHMTISRLWNLLHEAEEKSNTDDVIILEYI